MQAQPEIKFGSFPWTPVQATPNPGHTAIIYRAQSILTMNGKLGPILPYEQALDVVKWADRTPVK